MWKNKIKLSFLSKQSKKFLQFIPNITEVETGNISQKVMILKTYKLINKLQFVIFEHSTLGFEALSKKIRGVCFPDVFPYKFYSKKYKKKTDCFGQQKLMKKIYFLRLIRLSI